MFGTVKHMQHGTQGRGDRMTGLFPPCLPSAICEKMVECRLVKSGTPNKVYSMENLGFEKSKKKIFFLSGITHFNLDIHLLIL